MHIIQDSYARAHTSRDKDGRILEFHCYKNQDQDKHAHHDKLVDDSINNIAWSAQIVTACARMLNYYQNANTWEKARKYLERNVLKLSPKARESGPGKEFAKMQPMLLNEENDAEQKEIIYKITGYVRDHDPGADFGFGDHE